jgi:hypothetical protein
VPAAINISHRMSFRAVDINLTVDTFMRTFEISHVIQTSCSGQSGIYKLLVLAVILLTFLNVPCSNRDRDGDNPD